MHLVQRVATVVLTLGLSAGLVGCGGFHLKGTNPTAAPLAYQRLNLALPKNTDELEKQLSVYLAASGVQLSNANDAYSFITLNCHFSDRRSPRQSDYCATHFNRSA